MSNYIFDEINSRKNNNNNRNRREQENSNNDNRNNNENDDYPILSFTYILLKLKEKLCCGKLGHESPNYHSKNKILRE